MANAPTNSDPALAGVKIITLSPTNKTSGNRVALIEVDGNFLPNYFIADEAKDATQAALSFYRESVFNQVFDFSQADQTEVQRRVLSAFVPAKKTEPKPRKNAAPPKEKGEDRRHAFANLLWYVNKDDKPVRLNKGQIEKYEADGYLPGKKYAVALARYEGTNLKTKKGAAGYVNPIAGKMLLHRGTETCRAEDDQVADLIKHGWTRGRVPKVAPAAPEKATEPVSDTQGTEATPE